MFRFTIALALLGVAAGSPITAPGSSPSLKIIGGYQTDIKDHPWQISVQYIRTHQCGGSLISDTWVLTAAHCVDEDKIPSNLTIRAGSRERTIGGRIVSVKRVIRHPEYNRMNLDNDIALLELTSAVPFNENVQAIKLPDARQDVPDNTLVSVTGWGYTSLDIHGRESGSLREIIVPTIRQSKCRAAYRGIGGVTKNMFCAGLLGIGGQDSCRKDDGGPAVIDGEVVGIVSWGNSCADPKFPGVYTKVSVYRNWINQNAGI